MHEMTGKTPIAPSSNSDDTGQGSVDGGGEVGRKTKHSRECANHAAAYTLCICAPGHACTKPEGTNSSPIIN